MDTHKTTARIVGALFLIAMVASLVGGIWLESIITAPDTLDNVAAKETEVVLGVLLELINGLAVIGIAVLLFPLLKQQDETWALGYVALRIIEAVLIIAALVIPLALVALSQEYTAADAAGASSLQTAGTAFLAARETLAGQMMGIFFGLGALVLFVLLYQSRLVPRFISVWGLIAAVSILVWNLLEMVGLHVSVGMVFALPIILNEIFLGFWLIIKGFDTPAAVPGPAA
jgi:hypothetical protein